MPPTPPESHDPPRDLDPTLDANTLSLPSPGRVFSRSPSQLPQRIGDYVIIGKLGEGGMGVVYEAEQQHPKRRVALKVVRGGRFVSEIEVKMFEREAETLARLKHPNIAAIYESGRTEEGQHFFAMELVRGETLDAYAKRHAHADIRERLGLFRAICDAVNYAHQRGVIHRDLKPSNIVVVQEEAATTGSGAQTGSSTTHVPTVKILDFGLARITDADAAASIMSEVGAIKGTLSYMSPEQARGNPAEIDLRADVYALGVILYQRLTGVLPYDTSRSSLLEAARVICDEPPRSMRSDSAAHRIDGDIETIVLKAIEKDPDRRYQSAAAFSDDIDRYLTSQPILARPPSTVYQLKKLVARNKLPFAFAGVVVALLVAFGVWMSVLYSRAEAARQDSEAVTGFLSNMLAAVDPGKKGKDVTVRAVLDEAARTIGEKFQEQPLVRARLMVTMGDVYRKLGYYAEARPLLENSLAIREKALGLNHPDVAQSLNNLAILLRSTGDYTGARTRYERSLAIREKALGPDHQDVAQSLNNLANLLRDAGDYAEARQLYERTIAIREKALGPDHPLVALSLNNLAALLYVTGDYAGARPFQERSLAIRENALGPDHPDVAQSLHNLANLLAAAGNYAEARPLYERALAIRERALGPNHADVASSLDNLAVLLLKSGDNAGARPLHERALAIREKALGPDHPDVALSLNNLTVVLDATGDHAGARALCERALAIREKALGPGHPLVASSLGNLAELLSDTGALSEARPLYERALAIQEKALGPDHPEMAQTLGGLAGTLRKLGEPTKADSLEARAKAIRERHAESG